MKKYLILFLVLSIFLVGCEDKVEDINDSGTLKDTINDVIDDSKGDNKNANDSLDNEEKEEETSSNEENKDINPPIEEPQKQEVPVNSTKEPEPTKEPEKTCTEKKFNNTYSYIYEDKDECQRKGNDDYFYVIDNIDSGISSYGCEQIVDDCGNSYWGVYFGKWNIETEKMDKVHY